MELQVDDVRPELSDAGHGALGPASRVVGARSAPEDLRATLQSIADEIDGLWRRALDSQDLDLVTRAVDASHGVHRALLALGDDRVVRGTVRQGVKGAVRLGTHGRAPS